MTGVNEVEQPITRRQHSVSPAGTPDAGSRRLLDGPPDLYDRRVVASLPLPSPERLRELAALLLAHAQRRAS
jgi:hypothetical protein